MLSQKSHKIIIRDSTLREGIQVPGVSISLDDRIKFVRALEAMGVPEIEIGLPEGIDASADLARYVYENDFSLKTTALVPAYIPNWKKQIERAVASYFSKVYITVPTSEILLRDYSFYTMRKDEIIPRLRECITYTKKYDLALGIGLIDASRTQVDFLSQICKEVEMQGVGEGIIYDTTGVCTPNVLFQMISSLLRESSLSLIAHCHNDYGMATANSIAAVQAGASGVEVSVNGLGGRSGNASLEEVVLALRNLLGRDTGIDISQMKELSLLVEKISGLACFPLKPIVGKFSFVHTPVMHIRCIANGQSNSFEPFDPGEIGRDRRYAFSLPVDYTKAIEPFFKKAGLSPSPKDKEAVLSAVKEKSSQNGLTECEITQIIQETVSNG